MHDFVQAENKKKNSSYLHILLTGGGGGGGSSNSLTLAPYLSSQVSSSTRPESTIFDQVYGGYRRRPAMISLNVQWVPVNDHSGAYQWSGNDNNSSSSRKVKTVTFFGTGEMRGQQQAKAVTPPSSDYTDAYLSTFASKPITTRHIHRLSTSVFANSAPIPLKPTSTPLYTSSSTKTSQTRFDNINNVQTSTSFDKPVSSSSTQSTAYSSSFVPEKPPTYEPFVSTQYSSPQSQTFTSSYSTLLRTPASTTASTPSPSFDSQRSYTDFQTRPPPSTSAFATAFRSETSYDSIYKPMAPYSVQSYPPSNINTTSIPSPSTTSPYKSYQPFESTSLSTSSNVNQRNTTERIFVPPPKIEKPIDRPETLLFQHDEDIRPTRIAKPSPMFSPSPDSPSTREELKVEPPSSRTDALSTTSSAPIRILENTLNKYDSLINQISEVLASVSPLSSTVSSISPGKSVLDYQLSSDNSPILPYKDIENQLRQQSTTASVKSNGASRTKTSHLIREDSYDKIVTAISDLDNIMISPSDTQHPPETINEEIEEIKTLSRDDIQVPSITEEEKLQSTVPSFNDYQSQSRNPQEEKEEEDMKLSLLDKHSTSSEIEKDKEEMVTTSTEQQHGPYITEEETKSSSLDEHQTSPITEETKKEITQAASTVAEFNDEPKPSSINEQHGSSITQEKPTNAIVEEQQVSKSIANEGEEVKTSLTDEHQVPSKQVDNKHEETKTLSTDEHQVPSATEEGKEEKTKVSLTDQSQIASISEEQTVSIDEEFKEELKTVLADRQQVSSVTHDEKVASSKVSSTEDQKVPTFTEQEDSERQNINTDEDHILSSLKEETETSFVDQPRTEVVIEIDNKEESANASTDEQPTASFIEQNKEVMEGSFSDDHQHPLVGEKEKVGTLITISQEQPTSSVIEQGNEEMTVQSSEQQISSAVKEEKEQATIPLPEQQQTSPVPEESPVLSAAPSSDISASEISESSDLKSDEKKVDDEQATVGTTSETAQFVQEQTGLLTNIPNDVSIIDEAEQTSADALLAKKNEKHVTWDETVVDNEEDESSLYQSLSEDSSTSESATITTAEDNSTAAAIGSEHVTSEEAKITADQQVKSSDITESQITFDHTIHPSISPESSTPSSTTIDQQITIPDSTDLPITSSEQQLSSSSHPQNQRDQEEDSTNQKIMPTDLIEPTPYDRERQIRSISPTGTPSLSITDSSKEDTFTVDEVSTTTSSVIDNEDISSRVEEPKTTENESRVEAIIDEHKVETSPQIVENIPPTYQTSTTESSTPLLQPSIVSPIDKLVATVANRYISSDVYHGYLGEHKQFLQDSLDVDNDTTTKSLIASLRETITAPITPLIETIQSVVSSMKTTTVPEPLKTESEITDNTQDDAVLTTTNVQESKEEIGKSLDQIEENKTTVDTSEDSKTIFESLREAMTTPIAAIAETIQTAVSNLQSDQKEIASTSDTEQPITALEEKSSSDSINHSDEKIDDHLIAKNEHAQSSLLDSIQEKVSNTITNLTDTIQNVVSTNKASNDAPTKDEFSVASDTARDKAKLNTPESNVSYITDTAISTSSDTTRAAPEETHEPNENSETTFEEPSPVKTSELASAIQNIEEPTTTASAVSTPDTQGDVTPSEIPEMMSVDRKTEDEDREKIASSSTIEPIVMPTQTAPEQIDLIDKQEAAQIESPSTEKPNEVITEQKTDEDASAETKTTLEVIRDAITHPFATISEKFHSIMPTSTTEQTDEPALELTKSSIGISEEAGTANAVTIDRTIDLPIETDKVESTDTKTTFETIRDVITHPLATISEKIHNVMSSSNTEHIDQDSSAATTSSNSTSEQIESLEKQSSLETTSATTMDEHLDSSESKTTFDTLRDVITHPLATITEKIQSVLSSSSSSSSSTTVEEVPSSDQQTSIIPIDQNKVTDVATKETESTSETNQDTITKPSTAITETVEDIVSNAIDQTSSSQEKEQILTFEESHLYSQDRIQGEQTIIKTTIPLRTESESIAESQNSVFTETTSDANKVLIDTIRDLINDTINSVIYNLNENILENGSISEETDSSERILTSPLTFLSVDDKSESSQSTVNHEILTDEVDRPDNKPSISDITWINLVGEKSADEIFNQSFEEIKQLLEEVVQTSDHLTAETTEEKTTITLPDQTQSESIIQHVTQQTIIAPQTDDITHQSKNTIQSDVISTNVEINKDRSSDSHEPSPSNTEEDSSELIHALQGHSIILPSLSPIQAQSPTNQPSRSTSLGEKHDEQVLQGPEKSSSSTTTTSSQITSSDRYVSYAIHQMGDSSQERLPPFPIAADIPIYQSNKTTSGENKEQHLLSEPSMNIHQVGTKDDDLTELDATENLTSYSDDIHLQKHQNLRSNQAEKLDASSTDEDVDEENFNEFEQPDISNLHRIMEDIIQPSHSLSERYDQTYQRYDLSNSSLSNKQQTDDIYIIPGYPGLWRPSADDDDSNHSGFADDEDEKHQSPTTVRTRTIVRTTNPAKLQSFLQQQQITNQDIPLRPETIDVFNRPLKEFSFDISESDSFKTCASTVNSSSTSKQLKQSDRYQIPISEQQEHQLSPDEKIILIRERERGVSLPVTMKIDYDDMALRLSASTPIDAPLYSTTQTDLPSPSTSSEPVQKTTSSSRASSPSLSSNESEQQKLPSTSWLNTINTITTTTEGPDGPLESRTTIHKSAKGPISIAECEPQGKYILIENTSRSKSLALAGWTIHQENDDGDILTFTFPDNCLLRSNQSLKVLSKSNETERRNSDLIASLLSSWHTGSNVVTKLINAEGKDRAALTKKTLFS